MLTHTTVNGIRVLWDDLPPPFSAALVFLAGASDETVRTTGVAHLAEHLVMSAQPRTPLDVNAFVDDVVTTFHATGNRDEVLAWLSGICTTIGDVPLDRIAVEAKVLDAEDGQSVHPAIAFSAGARFGAAGVGMLGRGGAPHRTLRAEHVVDFVARRYHSDNAVVVLSGPPPEGFDIRLPSGACSERPVPQIGSLALPAYICGAPVPIVSWLVRRSPVAPVLLALVDDDLTETLRHQQGLLYDVGGGSARVTDDEGLAVLWADGAEEDQPRILEYAVDVLRRLAVDGPRDEELAHQKAVARAQMSDPRGTFDHLQFCAYRLLEGKPVLSVSESIDEIDAVTAADVRGAAAHAHETLLHVGRREAPGGIRGIPDRTDDTIPDHPEIQGRSWRRKLVSRAPLDLRVVVGDDGLTQTVHGHRHGGSWEDVMGVAQGPDFRAVVFRDGTQLVIWPSAVGDGQALADEIDRRAGDLAFEVEDDWL